MPFNPFAAPLGAALTPTDLLRLTENKVAEGFYVEYKQQLPAHHKVARSIASFANTSGGWYIVGVLTDAHNVPIAIPGFPADQYADPISTIQEVCKTHIDPVPIFHIQVVTLVDGRLVLAVYVPDGQSTPFVTKDGRVYRRVGESSDPVSETDRHALNQIIERGREVRQRFAEFAVDPRPWSKLDLDPWAALYLAPYPPGAIERRDVRNEETLHSLLEASRRPISIPIGDHTLTSGHVPFSDAHPTIDGLVLRQTWRGYAGERAFSMWLDESGRAKMFVPLNPRSGIEAWTQEYRSASAGLVVQERIIGTERAWLNLHRIDIDRLWLSVACLVAYYREWLNPGPTVTDFMVSIELRNVGRIVPFLDHDAWAVYTGRFGLPITFAEYHAPKPFLYENDGNLWFHLCRELAMSFGLTSELFAEVLPDVVAEAARRSSRTTA